MKRFALLFVFSALAGSAFSETKGNIEFVVYGGNAQELLPQYGATQPDLLWVSARDKSGLATHLAITATCPGFSPATETALSPVRPDGTVTIIVQRPRTQSCTITVESVIVGERQVFLSPAR